MHVFRTNPIEIQRGDEMRVTNSMMVNNLLRNLYKNYTKMDKSQQMLSSQKKFLRPSDDPIGVTRSLRLSTEILNMQQYKRNAEDSDSWLQSSEQAVNNIISVMQRIRELTVQGSNTGTYSPDDRKKIADEIKELKEQLIGIGNTAYAGSYLFSGFKTDKPLLNKDGTYDLDGGILRAGETIEVNVGISDRIGMNTLGQKIFGSMATTTYDEYVLKGVGEFKGVTLDGTNNDLVITYETTPPGSVTISMDNGTYNSIDGLRFVKDLNEKIDATPLKGLVKAELEDGIVVFKGARNFNIDTTGTTMDVKDIMGIEKGKNADLSKVVVSDIDDIDREIFHGSTEYLLKAEGGFSGTAAGDSFVIYYGDNKYTITMDRAYTAAEDKEFIYDFNKKLAETSGLAGHVKLSMKDGQFAISADKNFKLDAANFNKLGFEDATSGLKGAKAAYAIEGGKLDLVYGDITIPASPDNKLYIKYGGNNYTINLTSKTYNNTPGNTFDDLIKDIQHQINTDPALNDLKGYVTVTGVDGSIKFNSDSPFDLVYGGTPVTNVALMASLGFTTEKEGLLIGDRVESGGATQLLGMLDKLIEDLNTNNSDGISKNLARLDAHIGNLNSVRAEMGVKANRLELTLNRIEDDNVNLRGLLSKNEDIDMAETIIKLQMQENVYNAALSVGSKIISLSLVDFIR